MIAKTIAWKDVTDGEYKISSDGDLQWLNITINITIKGNTVIYEDGSQGPLSDIYGSWLIVKR